MAQTREAYERSKDALEAAVETVERSFDAAGQGAAALNRKIIDIAQRNVNSGFDLAKEPWRRPRPSPRSMELPGRPTGASSSARSRPKPSAKCHKRKSEPLVGAVRVTSAKEKPWGVTRARESGKFALPLGVHPTRTVVSRLCLWGRPGHDAPAHKFDTLHLFP